MKNGTTSSLWFLLPNLEKGSAADRSSLIVAIWPTPSFMWTGRAARGGCCRGTSALGKRSMATFGSGVRIGPGHSFTTRCEIGCARPKSERSHRYLALHYCASARNESQYWADGRAASMPSREAVCEKIVLAVPG